jgi:NADPH-dependent 2,4-dienoyl-CoA reductase/sulfur reductase-like enzyme/nitrite reductase/ring-hydroxylating ferredoxin subunit
LEENGKMAGETKLKGPDLSTEGIAADDVGHQIPAVGHVDGKPVIVLRTRAGLRAVGGRCTHYGGPLGDGLFDGERIHCPWHHAIFDIETGEAVGAPALNPIPTYHATERDGRVYVTGPVEAPSVVRTPVSNPESVVIVGAGAAGAIAAETLRRYGYTNPITLIGSEAPVDRPNLSKDYLAGTAPEEWMPLRSGDFYKNHAIDLMVDRRVVSIDPTGRRIELDDGNNISYGALLLAPGAEPRRLPLKGGDLPHVYYLRSFDDSRRIISALQGASNAVIVGAGFIGLEVAASLRHRGLEVSVVEPDIIPLARVIGETLGRFVRGLHEEHGVVFHLGRTITEIGSGEVMLDDATAIPADLVVIGIGVTPRVELAAEAGLDVDAGIVVNDRLRTSDPQIWAAGDVARYPDPWAGQVRVEHWVLAERQGQTAARNMLGHDVSFDDPPFFWSQHYDVPINMTGHVADFDQEVVAGSANDRDVIVGFRKAGAIRAVASIYRDLDSLRAEQALATDDQTALAQLFHD